MKKKKLLKAIARNALQIGIRGKKSFISYDIYRIFPRLISLLTVIIGVFQLSSFYTISVNGVWKELLSVVLIGVGIIGIVLDLLSDGKEKFNKAGISLIRLYYQLHDLYLEAQSLDEDSPRIKELDEKRKQIVEDAETEELSITDPAFFTHWYSYISYFKTMNPDWVKEELALRKLAKYPLFHYETFIIIILMAVLVRMFW